MANLTYIKETHRVHGTTYDAVLCQEHFAELPEFMKTPHGYNASGYKVDVHPWTGSEKQECSQCGLAPEFKSMIAELGVER